MSILLSEPLDPRTAETYDGAFWALRLGNYHAARIESKYPPRGGAHDEWQAQGPRGIIYGYVHRLDGDDFRPSSPQGEPGIVQGSLVAALARILPA